MKLYKVTFSFSESYRPKSAGWLNISLVVTADNQFSALANAWKQIANLPDLPAEATSFSAERCEKE